MNEYIFPETDAPIILSDASVLLNRLLNNRDVLDKESATAFLNPDYDTQLHDPWLLHDMDIAITRIVLAIEKNERIAIFSDYDCDGIPGAVVLHDCFKAIGYDNFQNYIPHRHYEGFGLSEEAVDKLEKDAVKLIITIDCGTTNVTPVLHATSKGIDCIITDHHEPGEVLPEALAIVNPKFGNYPFTELCGTGVIFKVCQALLQKTTHDLVPGYEKWWLDMVGIATVADMVPLTGENRVLAHYGLQVLRKSRRPGLQQLLKKNKVEQHLVSEEDIGFTIGPRINAASRMDTPEDAFALLAATDEGEARGYLKHLEELNQERKTAVSLITRDLHKRLEHLDKIPEVIVLGNPEWRPSLVGLAANKLAEEHGKPVFLWGKDGNGVFKGSCRSGGLVSVVDLMNAASEVFTEYGGHHFSGGFGVKNDAIFTFGEALNKAFLSLGAESKIKETKVIDEVLSLTDVTLSLVQDIANMAPYGVANPKPLFAFPKVTPRKVEQFGKAKEHLKLVFETDTGTVEAIAFFATPESYAKVPSSDYSQTLIAHVEKSFFMGRHQIRLRIVDIV